MMSSEHSKINQITEGVIWKQLLIFFFPIAVGTIFQQLYNIADTVIVGRFIGKQALASVGGSVAALTYMIISFFTGLASGATVIISQFYGARDVRHLHKALHTAYAFSLILGFVISIVGWILTPAILTAMDTPAEGLNDSIIYLRIYFLGMIGTLIYNMGSGIMRAAGDSKRPLYYLIICSILNIVLDLFMVVVLDLGIAGASLATIISQLVSALLVSHALMHSYDILKLVPKLIRIDAAILISELRIGLPGGLQACGYGMTNIILQFTINGFGTDVTAAWAAFGKLDLMFWAISAAFGVAIATFTGQNYGAGKTDRIFRSVRVCLTMSLGICGVTLASMIVFGRPLFHIFTTDREVIEIGVYILTYILPSYIIYVFVEILTGALRGIGDVVLPTIFTLGGVCLFRLPWLLLIARTHHEISLVILSYPIAWSATTLCLIPYYLYQKRRMTARFRSADNA